jgi:hypothetical protein
MRKVNPKSFTVEYPSVVDGIVTSCLICEAFDSSVEVKNRPKMFEFAGLWDTGATMTCISSRVVRQLDIKHVGFAKMIHANGDSRVCKHLVNIGLPNGVGFYSVSVLECELNGIDVLVGMDIISMGDFSITNTGGKTVFSFRFPSLQRIDFVEADNKVAHTPYLAPIRQSRNELCNCNSGKKYKDCCGK